MPSDHIGHTCSAEVYFGQNSNPEERPRQHNKTDNNMVVPEISPSANYLFRMLF